MVHRLDERLTLDVEQGVMLWCLRAWVSGLRQPNGVVERIGQMVDCLGAPEAGAYVDGFMFALSHGAVRTIGIACTCCPDISGDERVLLDVMGLAQQGRPREALIRLRGMVTPEAARAVLRSAEGLGMELGLAGWFLKAPEPVSSYGMAVGLAADRRVARVLH